MSYTQLLLLQLHIILLQHSEVYNYCFLVYLRLNSAKLRSDKVYN